MITITSYLHRERLCDMIRRWMKDEPRRRDVEEIPRLVHFNNLFVSRYLRLFTEDLFTGMHRLKMEPRRARLKGDLKDVIIENMPYRNPRIDELVQNYLASPELYYRETPFHGTLYFTLQGGAKRYVGSNRIKRVRRLAEKSARRIIDWIFSAIKKQADQLAEQRARILGISRDRLITPPEDMIAEFLNSESRLLEDLKHHRPISDPEEMIINDVAGIKIIVEDPEQCNVLRMIEARPDCEIIEIEPHTGLYNAVNLIVRYRPPQERILPAPLGEGFLRVMRRRGVSPDEITRQFREFILSGEQTVQLEIILCNYEEMLESEIGRCIHEDRIIRQRLDQQYNGQLARNIEYLMEYLFAFPASTETRLDELPVKLWHRYLPDYFDEMMRRLFHVPSIEIFD